jgi:hypothetical protein
MTEKEAIKQLNELVDNPTGWPHEKADSIICDFLEDNGFKAISDAYYEARDTIGFWYT